MEIKFYESADGQVPVRDFLDGLDIKMRQKCSVQLWLCKKWDIPCVCLYRSFLKMVFLNFGRRLETISAECCISSCLEIKRF